jgi:catechol 2,3-dioxygenase-like lactoylglutathione lyase family enzyme
MLRGMATVNYWTADLPAARKWYTELLGVEPYFEVPGAYLEFRIGDYQHELGLINSDYVPAGTSPDPAPGGEILYWHVDDLQASLARLLSMGASEHQPVTERGHGFVTASVIDPFGNVLGIMINPHYLDMLADR